MNVMCRRPVSAQSPGISIPYLEHVRLFNMVGTVDRVRCIPHSGCPKDWGNMTPQSAIVLIKADDRPCVMGNVAKTSTGLLHHFLYGMPIFRYKYG